MWNYRKRVLADIRRWKAEGWIADEAETAIAKDLASRGSGFGTVGALAILGAVLIGFAAMSFVAANWQDMSRLARLGLLFASLWASYGAAGWLVSRNMSLFANAATLIGVSLFGASIMLIAQMFHIEGNPPDAVLMWAAGTLLAGVALSSTSALGLAMPLVMLWGSWEQIQTQDVFWNFLPVWAVVTGAFYWLKWRPGLHLSAIALTLFVISLGSTLWSGGAHGVVAVIGLAVVAAAYAARNFFAEELHDETIVVTGYGMITAFAGLFALQFVEDNELSGLILLAALTLALLLGAIYWGIKHEQRAILWLGYVGFSIEILALYFKTIGTLLGSSLFFLIAGVIVLALAGAAYQLHKRSDLMEAH